MYWIVSKIGSPKGNVDKHRFHPLTQFSQRTIDKLLEQGVIRIIQAPRLEIMAELREHATLLNDAGVYTLLDVLRLGVEGLRGIIPDLNHKAILHKIETLLRPDTPIPEGACDCE